MLRLAVIIGFIVAIGTLISGLVAYRAYEQELLVDRVAVIRGIDNHASLVQERLGARELLTRVAVGLFRSPPMNKLDVLQPLRSSIYTFQMDFVVAGWIAREPPSALNIVMAELKSAGFPKPFIRNFDDVPLNLDAIREPINVLMAVEPQSDNLKALVGRTFNTHPVIGPMLTSALKDGKPIASNPLPLLGSEGPMGIVLAAPVRMEGGEGIIGFFTMSYRLAPLMLTNSESPLFSVALRDPNDISKELILNHDGEAAVSPVSEYMEGGPLLRTVMFGNKSWTLAYYPKVGSTARAQGLAAIILAIGLVLTAILGSLFGYVSHSNVRLSREIDTRIGFERRLTAVINELNHRVKNILAVIQSIITRSMRHGADLDIARELLIGRIHAMAHVVSLLSDSQWQGVKLKELFDSRAIPCGDRIEINGPNITVSARAAQSLSLLFFELASHSDEGLSLVGKHPHIVAQWNVSDDADDPVFHFRWEEFNTSAATRHPDSEFGLALLDRVAPEALGGISKRYFTDVSYVYELTAPMKAVVDENEMDRMEQISANSYSEF